MPLFEEEEIRGDRMSRFMVTGGAGFIGGHITEYLISNGHDVVVFDNLSTGKLDNLAAVYDQVTFVQGDIRDKRSMYDAMDGVDCVMHHAAEISTVKSVSEPDICNAVNVDGTLNVLMVARDCGVKRFVMASSSAIYGDTGKEPQREDFLPHPLSPYGASKICAEHYCEVFYQIYGLETVRLRYFNVFGPRQNPNSDYAAVIPKFIDRVYKNENLHIFGDGEQTRDFVFVENIAQANYLACTAENVAGKVFNIASEHSITVTELASKILELSGKKVNTVYDPPKTGDIKYSVSCTDRARQELGYLPKVSFEDGLLRTIDYIGSL